MQRGDGAQKRKNERNPKDRRKEGEMNVHNGRLKELKTERQKERRHERKTDTRDLTNVSELFLFLALANELCRASFCAGLGFMTTHANASSLSNLIG